MIDGSRRTHSRSAYKRQSAPGRVFAGLSAHSAATTSSPSRSTRVTSRSRSSGSAFARPPRTIASAVVWASSERSAGSTPPGSSCASRGSSIAGRRGRRESAGASLMGTVSPTVGNQGELVMAARDDSRIHAFVRSAEGILAIATAIAIGVSLTLRAVHGPVAAELAPLITVVVAGGVPLVWRITKDLWARAPGADLLAVLGIGTSALLGEWLVGAIIVLMLSGGEALENAATSRANAVLDALARRAPSTAHRVPVGGGAPLDVPVGEVEAGDLLLVLPHELCPVDGEVVDGHGTMDESYLTGEPYVITKSSGSAVLSGSVNGEAALTVRATTVAADSRYAKIVGVLTEAEQNRPRLRRLADRLGLWYTALAVVMGVAGWAISGDPDRFLAVMVIATPCPLLIAVPLAIVGPISLAARAGIIIKDPCVFERISTTDTMMFDKTGTLTYGRAALIEVGVAPGADEATVLRLAGELERSSRHPRASAITAATAGRSGADGGRRWRR